MADPCPLTADPCPLLRIEAEMFQFRSPQRLHWAAGGAVHPSLQLLNGKDVPGCGFPHLDLEPGGRPETLDPAILSEPRKPQRRGFVQRLGPDLDAVRHRRGALKTDD